MGDDIRNLCRRLADEVRRKNSEEDLPDFIVPLLLTVADHPERFAGREELVAKLLERVADYETFSNVCCEKIGFSLEDIQRTLDELRVGY